MSDWLFRLAVLLYPSRIRARFGAEMTEYMRTGYRRRVAVSGRLSYWRHFVVDQAAGLGATWLDRPPRSREFGIGLFARDLIRSVRDLGRQPGFALAAIATLAIGIGATTAVFSLLDAVVLSPLPYPQPQQLVRIVQQYSPSRRFNISAADLLGIEELQSSFASVAAFTRSDVIVSSGEQPQRVAAAAVTAAFFEALGVVPETGRGFVAGEDRPGAAPVVVLSADLRDRTFGLDAHAIGKPIVIDGQSHTVVGVLAPGIHELAGRRAQLWRALQVVEPSRRGPFFLSAIARLRPDQTLERAEADLVRVSEQLFSRWADSFRDENVRLTPVPLRTILVGDVGRQLTIVFIAVGLVLVIAIANVVSLVVARAAGRAGDLAVRAALGATRARIAQLMFTEGMAIAVPGALMGLGLASVAIRAFRDADPSIPRLAEVSVGVPSLGLAAVIAVVTSALLAAAPLLLASPSTVPTRLQAAARGSTGTRRGNVVRTAVVALQFALALPLLVAGALLATTLMNLARVDPGFDPAGVIAVPIGLPAAGYAEDDDVRRFWTEAVGAVRDIPAVAAVGISLGLPPDAPTWTNNFDLVDRPVEAGTSEPVTPWAAVGDGFLEALGLPLLEGRWFERGVDATGPMPLVVTESWAKRFYPGESALGKQVFEGGNREQASTIIGVVGDVKYAGLSSGGEAVYFPVYHYWQRSMSLLIRVADTTDAITDTIRARIAQLDPGLPPPEITTMQARLDSSISGPRLWTRILLLFGAAALSLTAVGMFGILDFAVRQQTREIGVRIAIGANPTAIVRLVVLRALRVTGVGLAVGLGLSFVATRSLESQLFGVGRNDPMTLVIACAGLLIVALIACTVPARRAAAVDPTAAISSA